jgi:signal transduction histidine kinase
VSLRVRLTFLITALAAIVVLALSALQLHTLVSTWLRHAAELAHNTARIVQIYVIQRANEHVASIVPPPPAAEVPAHWRAGIARDAGLQALLARTLAQTRAVAEISVADTRGAVLHSSTPARVGGSLASRLPLTDLQQLPFLEVLYAVAGGTIDYEVRMPLGQAGTSEPLFTVQVLVSSLLLREMFMPEVRRLALVSLLALAAALAAAYLTSRAALRPLAHLSLDIDRLARAAPPTAPPPAVSGAREISIVQEKLRLLGQQFRVSVEQLAASAEEALLLLDPWGSVMLASPAAERLLRQPRGAMLGLKYNQVFPPDSPLGAAIESLAAARQHAQLHVQGLSVTCDPLPGGGLLLRLRDVEGRKLLESHLSLATRLTAINRLTGSVAHEIKNPLNSIALHLELLRSRVLPGMPEAGGEIEIIGQEIRRLDRVVRTFLDYTRPVELKTEDIDLRGLAGELARLVGPEIARAGIVLDARLPETPVPVRGDRDLLRQAFLNVVRNGIEATPPGGTLAIVLGQDEAGAVFSVSDTGPGIPPENRERIFDLYYSTKEGGSGIGLTMTYRALQLHGGSIGVDSPPGAGCVFHLRLPLAEGKEAAV